MISQVVRRALFYTSRVATRSFHANIGNRAFSISAVARMSAPETTLLGSGAKPGTVPSDEDQATGLERFELLGKMQGIDVFDMKPLEMTHLGTKENPIVVQSLDTFRYVGCTGYPADSHDTLWITVEKEHEFDRCPECGSVFKLDFIGSENPHHH